MTSSAGNDRATATAPPRVAQLLETAVEAVGGTQRDGQVAMTDAVAEAMAEQQHLLVQAGTGTGKSLAYLIPAILHAQRRGTPVVVATATLALQAQLVGKDLPVLTEAITSHLRRPPTYAIYKGRSNYACLHRARDGVPDEQGVLTDVAPSGPLGQEVVALRQWVDEQADAVETGDRDDAPSHRDRAWAQVSVSARECLGADRCPYGAECFAERAKARAMAADVVITNHALLAIDALESFQVLPDYEVVIIDEAHELVARVTRTASEELTPGMVERAARRARPYCVGDEAGALDDAVEALREALANAAIGRVESLGGALGDAIVGVRDAARAAWSAFPSEQGGDAESEAGRRQARVQVDQVHTVAERITAMSALDVVWVAERERGGPQLQVAPLTVSGLLRERLFTERTCVLTSATLRLGGNFDALAQSVGLRPSDQRTHGSGEAETGAATVRTVGPTGITQEDASRAGAEDDHAGDTQGGDHSAGGDVPGSSSTAAASGMVEPIPWRGLDVGSPFDYRRQAICYVARGLAPPGRDGIANATLEELRALVEAAGGRTLGLFSSRRAAETAAVYLREHVSTPVLCQGDRQLAELQRCFVDDPATSLFGTLSLWQGLDVPGETCQLVVIDRIPFPRPDDPLMSARQRAVDEAGGGGFMAVAATHAALLLAQGVGRLIRRTTDRGVVAILDPRLATARYGGFLRASLPPMWNTVDRDVVLGALHRLSADADNGTA